MAGDVTTTTVALYAVAMHKGFHFIEQAEVGEDYREVARALAERVGADPETDGIYYVKVRRLTAPGCRFESFDPSKGRELFALAERRHDAETREAIGTLRRGAFEWQEWK